MQLLDGKVAIVTGASSGIGRAAAVLFAREGARLVVSARRRWLLDELVAELEADGARAFAVAGGVGDEAVAADVVETAVRSFGGLDIALNNAGCLGTMKPVPELTVDEWDETVRTNLTSAFLSAKHQLPAMVARGGGSLIFTSTFVGHTTGIPGMAAYAASKTGLIGLTKVLASEYGTRGVRVNALLPGGTDTPMGRSVTDTPGARDHVMGLHALGRIAEPVEIARSALYLASDMASFTTGATLLADGGVSIHRG